MGYVAAYPATVPKATIHEKRESEMFENKIRFTKYLLMPSPASYAIRAEKPR
jgi:hypothetical protein